MNKNNVLVIVLAIAFLMILGLNPAYSQNSDYYYFQGIEYYEKGDYDNAIKNYNEAIKLNPKFAAAYNWRGLAYLKKKDYDNAIADYNEAIMFDPRDEDTYYNRGNAYSEKKDYDSAIANYEAALRLQSNMPNIVKALEAAKGLSPEYSKSPNYYYNVGNTRLEQDQRDCYPAIEAFTESIRLNSKSANTYFSRGIAYFNNGNFDKAITDFTEAIKIDPKFVNAYLRRSFVYSAKGDNDRAIADWEAAIRIDSPIDSLKSRNYCKWGTEYYNKKEYNLALKLCNEAIRLNPKNETAFSLRAHMYEDRYEIAITDYTIVINIRPNYWAYVYRGLAYFNKKDYDHAIADYTEAIRRIPEYENAYYYRGNVYLEKKDYDKAIADYEEALRISPNEAGIKKNLEKARKRGS